VALGEDAVNPDSNSRHIVYRILGDETNMSVMSHVLDLNDIVNNARIRFPHVAACYFEYPDPDLLQDPPPEAYTFVEITIVWQQWVSNSWQIEGVRLGFDPFALTDANILNLDSDSPLWESQFEITGGWPGFGLMMPDVAYDPRESQQVPPPPHYGGELSIVYTQYDTAVNAHVWMSRYDRRADPGYAPWTISPMSPDRARYQSPDSSVCGFHPRVEIGDISIGGPGWKVGVVYTGATYGPYADGFTAHVAFGTAGTWPPVFGDYYLGPSHNGGMPTIDCGLPGSDNGAVAWTQARSESWDDVTVVVCDYHGGVRVLDPNSGSVSSASPAVGVWNTGAAGFYTTAVSYLRTLNPNSTAWNPRSAAAVVNPIVPPSIYVSVPLPMDDTIHGEFDSGSQHTDSYGPATALTVDNDGHFWFLWSSRTGSQPGLSQVHGSYGFAQP
jgi:hypothetical protein